MASNEVIISLNNVVKSYGDFFAVDHFTLDIKKGQFVTILGPSGCGKTTTLRMIGGFELPSDGTILLNGEDITKLPPYKRPINTVFQRYALFPHLDVYDNVAFGLRFKRIPQPVFDENNKPVLVVDKGRIKELNEKIKEKNKEKAQKSKVSLEKSSLFERFISACKEALESKFGLFYLVLSGSAVLLSLLTIILGSIFTTNVLWLFFTYFVLMLGYLGSIFTFEVLTSIDQRKNESEEVKKLRKEIEELKAKPSAQKMKMIHYTKEEIDEMVIKALRVVDLEELEDRDITTLSGGQQQRVAIARCIINKPEILLLDEPLGALDLKMRKDMQIELKAMHKKLGITFIYVTHDQEEALTMSDLIVVMNHGVVQQVGTPEQIYNEPTNVFVADFIGESNLLNGVMTGSKVVKILGKEFKCLDDFPLNERVDVVVRPEDVKIRFKGEGDVDGVVTSKVFKGVHYEYLIQIGKNEILAKSTKDINDSEVGLSILPDGIHVMKKPNLQNLFVNCEVQKDNSVELSSGYVDVDLTQLIKGSQIDEDGYLVFKDKKYDLTGAKLTLEIDKAKVQISDDTEAGQILGVVSESIYEGDHYQIIVDTEDDESFIIDTEYEYNFGDNVSITLPKENIQIRLKGDISEYEI